MEASNRVERVKSFSDRYDVIQTIGKGTYGEVQKCRDRTTNDIVAAKRIFILRREDGFPLNTIREARLLFSLHHENIVELKLIIQSEDPQEGTYLIFEYCEYDLYALLYDVDETRPQPLLMKSLMKQFLVALHYCCINQIIHRDLKPANMFVSSHNVLKLGDFGLARTFEHKGKYSPKVITQWYRPPELLLGCTEYGPEVDIWSAGCILYEMATSKILFHAKNNDDDLSQLMCIFGVCGFPQKQVLDLYRKFDRVDLIFNPRMPQDTTSHLEEIFKEIDSENYPDLPDLLMEMLRYDPSKRITAEMALNHKFFRNITSEADPDMLPQMTRKEMHQKAASERKNKQKQIETLRPDRIRPPPVGAK
ncbi:CMGC family protein kinase [Histomonas meleagridis]|uniref:CMGC family protein kinase n=1 Tax=Histomonas meleagridis TaxID=135588 RepID=UPI00355AC399|nr:CMGC family protein kinase [Histomonas meleagridis]KAH0803662.1 CMGC family protein kinase [Histomonas meleagridis]